MPNDQSVLWDLIYEIIKMKPRRDASPNSCLNYLANERLPKGESILLNDKTAVVREEKWATDRLVELDPKHNRIHDFDDHRPAVVVEYKDRRILVDGNHRVARWLKNGLSAEHRILLISLLKDGN